VQAPAGTGPSPASPFGTPAPPVPLLRPCRLRAAPGPWGALGALEGVSYLAVLALVGWSLLTKAATGTGLRPGPLGLLGAAEGLSYLSLVAVAVVFALTYLQNGFIPGPLPSEQCFG